MNTLFSIVIPTLNEEKYLPLLLADLAHQQKSKNFEVLIVDGKSEDKTKEVALPFKKYFPLIFLEVDKRNVAFQRNTGATVAQGKFLVFLDADTRIPKNFLFELYRDCYLKHYMLVLPSIVWGQSSQKVKILHSFVKSLIRASHVYGKPLATGGNIIVEKSIFEKLRGFNEDILLSEDHDFVRKAFSQKIKAKIPKNLKVTISLRRSKAEGDMSLISKYVLAFLVYTMSPNEKMLKRKLFEYEMGGHKYDEEMLAKKQLLTGRKSERLRLKQLAQFSSILLALKNLSKI